MILYCHLLPGKSGDIVLSFNPKIAVKIILSQIARTFE